MSTRPASRSAESAARRARFKVLLLLAVLAAAIGVLAAPALAGAAPSPTSIDAHPLNATVTWGGHTILTGTLMDVGTLTALGGQWLRVERSPSGSPSSWTLIATVTTDGDAQYATGQYTQVVHPTALTYYRFAFAGTAEYAAIVSDTVRLMVRPALGRPVAPRAVKAGRRFTVYGSLKPHFAAGAKTVKVKAYRYRSGRWVAVKKAAATNADSGSYTRYAVKLRLFTKGKYRFRAYTLATGAWAAASTRLSKTLVVK